MGQDDESAAPAAGQLETEGAPLPGGDTPLPTARSGSGLSRAYAKCTIPDAATVCALLDVYDAATSLLQPGGLMSDLLSTDMTVGMSVAADQVIPALANFDGLLSAVRKANADNFLKHFVKAAIYDTLKVIAAADVASPNAPSTQ